MKRGRSKTMFKTNMMTNIKAREFNTEYEPGPGAGPENFAEDAV